VGRGGDDAYIGRQNTGERMNRERERERVREEVEVCQC